MNADSGLEPEATARMVIAANSFMTENTWVFQAIHLQNVMRTHEGLLLAAIATMVVDMAEVEAMKVVKDIEAVKAVIMEVLAAVIMEALAAAIMEALVAAVAAMVHEIFVAVVMAAALALVAATCLPMFATIFAFEDVASLTNLANSSMKFQLMMMLLIPNPCHTPRVFLPLPLPISRILAPPILSPLKIVYRITMLDCVLFELSFHCVAHCSICMLSDVASFSFSFPMFFRRWPFTPVRQ